MHVLERHALGEEVGDDGDAERVGRKRRRQGSVLEAAIHHAADVVGVEGAVDEPPGFADRRAEQRGVVGRILKARRLEVGHEGLLQVASDGDLAGLDAFFLEAERPLAAGVMEVAAAQLRHRVGAGIGIREGLTQLTPCSMTSNKLS